MRKKETEKGKSQENKKDKDVSPKIKKQINKFEKNKNDSGPVSHAGRKRSDEERYQ
jgi:hypothetical protein